MSAVEHVVSRPDAMTAGRGHELFDVRMSRTTRAWLRTARVLTAVGFYPSMERIPRVPVHKRQASRPPRWMTLPLPGGVEIVDHAAAELGLPVAVRTYAPPDRGSRLPIVVFMHGGGFVNGGLDAMQFLCAHLAVSARVVVVSVDYPLAPESVFPDALESSYAAVRWAAANGGDIGGDPERLSVAGDSAGGNLAAAVCLRARRDGFAHIGKQVLVYPTLDATQSTPRLEQEQAGRRDERSTYYRYYAAETALTDELISPLLAKTLEGLPEALILTAEHDALRDDGILYAQRLRAAGVPVRLTNYLGVPHGFLSMPRLCRAAAAQAILEIAGSLQEWQRP